MTQCRRWFQLHLSTAIVLMLIAGAFVGANVVPYQMGEDEVERKYGGAVIDLADERGEVFWQDTDGRWFQRGRPAACVDYFVWRGERRSYWNYWSIAWNVVVLLLVMAGAWAALEGSWRRAPASDVEAGN